MNGVFDSTLATYENWIGIEDVGKPIKPMCDRVRKWLEDGKTVKIFTARVYAIGMKLLNGEIQTEEMIKGPIEEFCMKEFGQILEITNVKDFGMIELWDDRCVEVVPNTGERIK